MKSDRQRAVQMLKTARGQIDGLIKMVEEDRYCIDISHQILAVQAILRKVNKDILHGHLNHWVKEAFSSDQAQTKIDEVMEIMDKLMKGWFYIAFSAWIVYNKRGFESNKRLWIGWVPCADLYRESVGGANR